MGDRYRTADGWAVEVVELAATPDRNDGERLKVTYCHVRQPRVIKLKLSPTGPPDRARDGHGHWPVAPLDSRLSGGNYR